MLCYKMPSQIYIKYSFENKINYYYFVCYIYILILHYLLVCIKCIPTRSDISFPNVTRQYSHPAEIANNIGHNKNKAKYLCKFLQQILNYIR